MWQFNILSIIRKVSSGDTYNGMVIILMIITILLLVIYTLNKNKTTK